MSSTRFPCLQAAKAICRIRLGVVAPIEVWSRMLLCVFMAIYSFFCLLTVLVCLKLVIGYQYFSGAFADNDAGSHRVTCRYARHNGSIGNAQAFDPIDLEIGVYYRDGITSHLGSTRLMPVGND